MSKSKLALLIGVLLVLLFLGFVVMRPLLPAHRGPADLQGAWEGALQVQTVKLRLVLKIQQAPDGSCTATMDSVDQGAAGIPVRSLTLSNDTVHADLGQLRAAYDARLNAAATEMTGQWRQAGQSFPLVLKRTATPSAIATSLPTNAYAPRADAPLQGYWRGTLNADGTPLRLAFQITADAPGKYRGSLNSIDQGAKNIPATTVEFADGTARIAVDSIDGEYQGTLKNDAELDGRWLQGGKEFRLTLQRSTPVDDTPPPSAYARTNDTELQGHWTATLGPRGNSLRLVFNIARLPDGTYSALLDSPDQGSRDLRATTATLKDSDVELEWKAMHALYHGTLKDGKITGFWQQGPVDSPLELQRTNPPTARP